MNHKQHLRHLEAKRPAACPECSQGHVVLARRAAAGGTPMATNVPDEPVLCPRCGSERPVVRIVEVVVSSQEEIERLRQTDADWL